MKNSILRKLCAISLAAVMLTGTAVCSLGVYATGNEEESVSVTETEKNEYKGFIYELKPDGYQKQGICIVGYNGKAEDIVIPSAINGIKVRWIGEDAFNSSSTRSIKIPATVTEIACGFTKNSRRIENFYVDKNNTIFRSVDGLLYKGDDLLAVPPTKKGELNLPEFTKGIMPYAFSGCYELTQLTMGDVDSLSADILKGCRGLERINIGSRTGHITPDFADELTCLEEINVVGEPGKYCSVDGVLFRTSYGYSPEADNEEAVPTDLIRYPMAKRIEFSYKIPDTVTTIWSSAFSEVRYGFGDILIGKNVSLIMKGAFKKCYISRIVVEKGNKNYRFNNGLLFESNMDDSLYPFSERKAYVKQGETLIAATRSAANSKVVIPSTVGSIGDYAFYSFAADEVVISKGVGSIGRAAFAGSFIKTLRIPNSVRYIGDEAFAGCNDLITATMGAGVESIGENAFTACSRLENIKIPKKTMQIADNAFDYCKSLTMCVKKGSYAEDYAKKNNIRYTNGAMSLKCLFDYNYIFTRNIEKLKLEAQGVDGSGSYEYAFYYKKSKSEKWVRTRDFSEKSAAIISPKAATDYDIMVKVRDTKTGKTREVIKYGIQVHSIER